MKRTKGKKDCVHLPFHYMLLSLPFFLSFVPLFFLFRLFRNRLPTEVQMVWARPG